MEKEYLKSKYIRKATTKVGKQQKQHTQSAMVVIDHKTGYVVGTVGGLGKIVHHWTKIEQHKVTYNQVLQ